MKLVVLSAAAAVLACVCWAAPAGALSDYPRVEHLHFAAGPYPVTPGANLILLDSNHVPKPDQDGFMVRVAPNLRYALRDGKCCGKIPRVDVIHLHHGVWLSNGTDGAGEGNSYGLVYPFMASGEEKTIYQFPRGYGDPVAAKDFWVLNYMIHNLTANAAKVYSTSPTTSTSCRPARQPSARSRRYIRSGWTSRTTTSTPSSTSGHVRVLLPDPPVYAGRVPDHPVACSRQAQRPQPPRLRDRVRSGFRARRRSGPALAALWPPTRRPQNEPGRKPERPGPLQADRLPADNHQGCPCRFPQRPLGRPRSGSGPAAP